MKNGIKIGCVAWGLPGGGIFAPRVASMAGLDGIQLELGSYASGYPLSQREVIEGYIEARINYKIEYPAIVVNDVMEHEFINGRNTDSGKIAYEQIALSVEVAGKLNINRIMIPNFVNNLITRPEHISNTIEALRFACEQAKSNDIVILTENSLDWKKQEALLQAVDKNNLSIHFDTQNFKFNFNMNQCEQLENLYPLMDHQLHVKDGIKLPGEKLLGEGNTDFFKQMEILNQKGYTGWIILENYYTMRPLCSEASDNNQMSLLQKDIRTLRSCFK